MKIFKKVLCLVLSVLMAFGCLTLVASAEGEAVKASLKYYSSKSNSYNAQITLDKIDEALKAADICEKVELGSQEIVVDFRSVNAVCNTIDEYITLIKIATFLGGGLLGDLGDLELGSWEKGMKRTGDDILILNEFIELIAANKHLVKKLCDGTIDLGVFEDYINVEDILGPDGISGTLKEAIFGIVYDTDAPEFANVYNTYKNDVDAFIFDELIPKFTNEPLPGLAIDAGTTVEELICQVGNISFDKYAADEIAKIDIDLASSDKPALKALDGIVNLKGSTYDLTGIKLDASQPLLGQLNGLFGKIVKQTVPSFEGWVDGDYTVIDDNLLAVSRYIGVKSNLIPDANSMSLEELAFEIQNIILSNADFGIYEKGLAECDSLEEMADTFSKNIADSMNLGVSYDEDDSYLVVVGDIFADWFYDRFDIKDLNGKVYRAGDGKDAFEVLNYFLNYFLFDKGGASVMGLSTTKSESVFKKIDKILDYFGQTKTKGVSFDSKEFFLGSAEKKGILDSVLTFDIENLFELTLVPMLNTAGDVAVVEFIYKSVQYYLNNWAGKTIFPTYQAKPFTNALSNSSIANLISGFLEVVNARAASVVTVLTFTAALLSKGEDLVYNVTEASVNDCEATGLKLYPDGSVAVDGKALTKGKDYLIYTDSEVPGQAKATIRFIGMYTGTVERTINVLLADVEKTDCTSSANSIKLVWDEVPYADGYNVYIKEGAVFRKLNDELVTVGQFVFTGLKSATEYEIRIDAVSNIYGVREGTVIDVATIPEKVGKITVLTDETRVRLIWNPVASATHYRVERYLGSNTWKDLGTTTKTDVALNGHKGYTEYNFRVTALKKLSNGSFIGAAPVSVKAKTKLGGITKLNVTGYTSNSITLSWNAVSNTQKYQLLYYTNGAWKSIKVLDSGVTSYKVTGLKTATKYTFAVRPAVKESNWIYGSYKTVTQASGLAKPKTFKVSATNASQAKLVWSKVSFAKSYEVFQYIGGKWVSKGTTKNTSAVISGLPSGTTTYFKVRAVMVLDGKNHYGDATGHIGALTLPGKVTGVKLVVRKPNSISFSWQKVTGAAGYQVFRLHNGKWVSLGTTTSLQWTDTKSLSKNTEYQYKVRAVQKVGSTLKYGDYSAVFKTKTTLVGSMYI